MYRSGNFGAALGISIHASAKEATKDTLARYFEDEISIHASAKEATENHFASEDSGNISIHASAKEATGMASRSKRWRNISIHASAKEATLNRSASGLWLLFQSTPPRRRRQHCPWNTVAVQRFQSTPPRRRRQLQYAIDTPESGISIHASAKEATGLELHASIWYTFQSTPPRRRRPQGDTGPRGPQDFNPRLREGGDRNIL